MMDSFERKTLKDAAAAQYARAAAAGALGLDPHPLTP